MQLRAEKAEFEEPPADEHVRAREISQHRIEVAEIRRRAQEWRLMDCSVETLEEMRHALIEEVESVERALAEADHRFLLYVENARPLETQETLHAINRLADDWQSLNRHLQEIDEALLELQLRTRLSDRLGGSQRLLWLDAMVFTSIIVVVALTLAEFLLPLPRSVISAIVAIDTVVCFFLIGDFFLRLSSAQDRNWYLRRYWIDLVASIPFYEFLRFGRLVRLVRFLRFARLFRLLRLRRALHILSYSFRGMGKLARTFQVNLLKRSVVIAVALLVFGAFSIRLLEGRFEASLLQTSESLWWSFTTMVTGGFADLYNPGTLAGRYITVGLVLLGLTVTGIFTASLTSVLVVDDSTLIRQNQHTIEIRLQEVNQRLDLLSGETNEGLLALETVSQELSNQRSAEGVAAVLVAALLRDFAGLQASVHLLEGDEAVLTRIAGGGDAEIMPRHRVALGEGLIGRLAAQLAAREDLAALDLEPETELSVKAQGLAMACPLVAGGRLLGVLHLVLPDNLGRFYLYNRVPMTLAHHAALAFYGAEWLKSP